MAKKQAAADSTTEAPPTETAAGKPEKKPRAPKGEKAPAGEQSAEAKPEAPQAEAAPKPAKAAAPADAGKKKKKAGVAPARGKKLRNHLKNVEQRITKDGPMPIAKAVSTLKSVKRAKFDETVEIHMSLGVDTTQSDQLVRGTVPLPHGIGKTVRVVVFCQGDNVGKAKDAGADFAGSDDLLEKIQKQNWLEFDVALATQDMMGKVSRLGKVLGPRGLMPTPKAGTVITGDVAQAVKDFKAGKVEFRTDKGGNVHAGVGKLSFEEDKLAANVTAFVEAIRAAKPAGIKGNYVKSITLSSTMGPGIALAM
ncbi:MAG TPA: 50S ribosomal protein L1 [Gemmataceae bacterium]|nr:50S ribosomal protein L1 [Gemmataceae bacterium]